MNQRIMIAGTHSGCGKTTVTMAVLSALKARGVDAAAFKCGPDYIDPMFHRRALGIPAFNLDPYFLDEDGLCRSLAAHGREISVVEGVMGFYDGIGTDGWASTYDVARKTKTPVILVVSAKGMYTSSGALLKGFREYKPDNRIRGVIFNGVNGMLYAGLKELAQQQGLIPLGYFPREEAAELGSRHLGLVTADEIADLQQRLEKLGQAAETCLDLDGILKIAGEADPLPQPERVESGKDAVRIAVARDEAFCFLYQENLDLLQELGCRIVPFSPIRDEEIPDHVQGLYLPGGYPELYLKELSENRSMLRDVREKIRGGLPTIAECGGFLYLHSMLNEVPMVGVFTGKAYQTSKLQRFGYATLTARKDNLLCGAGESIRVHEFHYFDSENNGQDFQAEKASNGKQYDACFGTETLYAGFPHLFFPANPEFAKNFVRKAMAYGTESKNQ